ncbi:MAG: threonine aldolase [Thermoleophilaceae bacterium]|jgi:threonine aldolase|nr:threonine aldolase [Thermoleophilaceae bacterium]
MSGSFASDNYAGALPEVLDAIAAANTGHAPAYGADEWTKRVEGRFRDAFGGDARAYLVFNGTGANVVALRAVTNPWDAVVCAETAHLNVDEGGAPERIGGLKLLTVATPDGKLTPELVAPKLARFGDEHAVQPRVISITQSTELGTVYTPEQIRALGDLAHDQGMLLHVDGSRLANAAAALGVPLREITTDAGVDALSFGGTKNGLVLGEAIVLLGPGLGEGIEYLRKQSMQLASKMRFLAAQFDALLDGERWRRSATHANAMARRLADGVAGADGVRVTQSVDANAVFAVLPPGAAERLQQRWRFYVWDETTGEVRWMCSWDTSPQDVDAFAADVAQEAAAVS